VFALAVDRENGNIAGMQAVQADALEARVALDFGQLLLPVLQRLEGRRCQT
jgi:hypothetical protein